MSAQQTPPPLTPYLTVDDAKGMIAFYEKAFGAVELARQAAPDGRLIHAALSLNGAMLMLCDDFPEYSADQTGQGRTPKALGGTPVALHLNLTDVDAVWNQAVAAGAKIVMPLAQQFWGDRFGVLEDPAGHRWSLATPKSQPTKDELDAGAEAHFGQK